MRKDMEISVILPCYNSENTIIRALDSLKMQSYQGFEVIVVNDGSTDHTDSVILDYLKRNKSENMKVHYRKQVNGGVSAARNLGLTCAKGNYITFLDSDDAYEPKFLECLFLGMKRYQTDTAFCSWRRADEKKGMNKECEEVMPIGRVMDIYMRKTKKTGFWGFMYRKEIIDTYRLEFPTGVTYGEDNEFLWKYLVHCNNAVYEPVAQYIYIENQQSVTHTMTWEYADALETLERIEAYMKENQNEFVTVFEPYMHARTRMSIAKNLARQGEYQIYAGFCEKYDVKKYVRSLLLDKNGLLALCASCMWVSIHLYYIVVYVWYKLKK